MENQKELANENDEGMCNEDQQPSWINKEYFAEFLKQNVENFKSIETFVVKPAAKSSEHYSCDLYKIQMKVILDNDETFKEMSYILKLSDSEAEVEMYNNILPRFKNMYHEQGVNITFGPKLYSLPKILGVTDETGFLMDDLKSIGFSTLDRLHGLNANETKKVLQKLAEFHAVSACYVEAYGPYEDMFQYNAEGTQQAYEDANIAYLYDYIMKYKGHEEYIDLIPNLLENFSDHAIAAFDTDPNEFNVLNHGDFWLNNIMMKKNDEEQLLDTYFVDYEKCIYGSPCRDLYIFLLSGTQLDIKIEYFDYFIQFYHDHLVTNLRLLKYPSKIPSLKELHISLLKRGYIGFASLFHFLSITKTNPKNEVEESMYYLMQNGSDDEEKSEAVEYRRQIFLNERFKSHAEIILPWLARRGLLE